MWIDSKNTITLRIMKMLNIRILTTMITLAILAIGAITPATADTPSTSVVIMDCAENDKDKFIVEDFSESVGVPPITLGMDCAVALQLCIESGFAIVAGGGGAIHDWQISKEHVLYTLVRKTQYTINGQTVVIGDSQEP